MAEYGGWVTLGDKSSKPPAPNPLEKSGSWLKPIHLTKSGQLQPPGAGGGVNARNDRIGAVAKVACAPEI